ncbi:MAG: ImmA/IrrE family metallo-endopeptidase [Burkholderiales bacterium]|nr:ImmA/IrrE family metallo-endopeptidase [Burkholderiales bacterium]
MVDPNLLSSAERLLWDHGFRKAEHIDLEGLASAKGARVVFRHLDGCAARLVTDGATAIISVEARDTEGRQRFSLGHELAHWINDVRTAAFKCASTDIGPQNAEAADTEAAANLYASQLLLPDYMVDPWMRGKKMTLNVAKDLHDEFRSSMTASAIKLAKRSETSTCVMCHDMRGRRWFVRSKRWPHDVYPKKELHHESAAFDIVFKATTRMSTPRKEPAGHWLTGPPDIFRSSAEVQSMKLPDGSALTMLMLIPR